MKPKLYLENGVPLFLVSAFDLILGEFKFPLTPYWLVSVFPGNYTFTMMVNGEWNGARYVFEDALPKELQDLLDSASD